MKLLILFTTLIFSIFSIAQESPAPIELEGALKRATEDLAYQKSLNPDNLTIKSVDVVEDKEENNWKLFIIWGYNRSYHAPSSSTWNTQDGTFTIHDARAKDRPSKFSFNKYFSLKNFAIPQYNLRIGAEKKTKNGSFGVEVGTDHMKWVFERQLDYKITGTYDKAVTAFDENGHIQDVTFEQIKEEGNAAPFAFEYSDGHNYVHISSFYHIDVFKTWDEKLKFSMGVEGGIGGYVPRPHVSLLNKESGWQNYGKNGKFQLAGYGFHLGAKARLTFFDRVFIESSLRGIGIKSKAKIYSPFEMTIEQSLMKSIQTYAGVGVIVKKFNKKKK